MRRRVIAIVSLLLLAGVAGMAQTAASAEPPTKEEVLHFLDLMQIRSRMVQMIDGMKGGMKTGAKAGLKEQLPNATPEQLAKVDAVAETVFKDFPIDEIVDAIIPIYQRHLTKADLESVIAFYSSPAGQRLLKEQPAMMAEGMKAGQDIMVKRIPDLTKRLNAEVERLAKEESQKTPPAPPTN
jgi:hypothetical protein